MTKLNPPYASSASNTWKQRVADIIAVCVVLGGVCLLISGCASVPVFFF